MNNKYFLYNESGQVIMSCSDVIESHDFSGLGYHYLFVFSGVQGVGHESMLIDQFVILKSPLFGERLNIEFHINKIIEPVPGTLYLYVDDIRPGMYDVGALAFLKLYGNDNERLWLDMKGSLKRIYISSSYLLRGECYDLSKNAVSIEGKYIHDYYSFFCEVGYSLFGGFGYVGDSIYSFEEFSSKIKKTDMVWKDSLLAIKAIDNTLPEGYRGRSAYDLLSILEGAFNLTLE